MCPPTTLSRGWLPGAAASAAVSDNIDRVIIVHDSENCIVPWLSFADPDTLRRAVVREAYEVEFGQQPRRLGVDVPVDFHMVTPSREVPQTRFSLHGAFVGKCKQVGYQLREARNKKGAVDHEVRDALNDIDARAEPGRDRARVLVVVLTADSDMSSDMQRLLRAGYKVVRIHGGNTNGAILRDQYGQSRDAPSWTHIVRHASDNRDGPTAWQWPGAETWVASEVSATSVEKVLRCKSALELRFAKQVCSKRINAAVNNSHPRINVKLGTDDDFLAIVVHTEDPAVSVAKVQEAVGKIKDILDEMISTSAYFNATHHGLLQAVHEAKLQRLKCAAYCVKPRVPKAGKPPVLLKIKAPIAWTHEQVEEHVQKHTGIAVKIATTGSKEDRTQAQARGTKAWMWPLVLPKADEAATANSAFWIVAMETEVHDGVKVHATGTLAFAEQVEGLVKCSVAADMHGGDKQAAVSRAKGALVAISDVLAGDEPAHLRAKASRQQGPPGGGGAASGVGGMPDPPTLGRAASDAMQREGTCDVCCEDFPEDDMLCCAQDHRMCSACTAGYCLHTITPSVLSDFNASVPCPACNVGGSGTAVHTWRPLDVVKVLPDDAVDAFMRMVDDVKYRIRRREAAVAQAEEEARQAALSQAERTLRAASNAIMTACTTECPRCGVGYVLEAGCNAVTCIACGTHSCRLCGMGHESSVEAHRCAYECAREITGEATFFPTPATNKALLIRRIASALQAYAPDVQSAALLRQRALLEDPDRNAWDLDALAAKGVSVPQAGAAAAAAAGGS